ncbi:MAG: dihydrolipoyllysine-residue succinyltransferase [Verrucomicrobiota bacterium]
MSIPVTIPSVGESITSGTIAEWHKGEGELVNAGDLLLTLETDKISTEVPAEGHGVLQITVAAGEEVEIGSVVGQLAEGSGAQAAPASAPPSSPAAPAAVAAEQVPSPPPEVAPPSSSGQPPPFTVVEKEDPAPPVSPPSDDSRTTRTRMSPLRRKIASHLVGAQQTAAILTTFNEADMSAIMALRKKMQESFVSRYGVKLGFMSFFVKAVVDALKTVPQVNARIEGEEVIQNHFFDLGVAIGTEKGLVVPVLRDCDQKNFAEIEGDILDYAAKAKDGRIQLADLQGGVMTISNGGVYGSLLSTPILNFPQSAILGMHTIQQRPVAVDGKVVIRPMMNLALSYDHRLIDGKEAVTFLVRIKQCIEQPARLMIGA